MRARTWHKAFEFPAGTVRHIHTVQLDPYDRRPLGGHG